MDHPDIRIVESSAAAFHKMTYGMKTRFDEADATEPDNSLLSALIEDPAELSAHAAELCVIMSPRCMQAILFAEGMPQDRRDQIRLAGALQVLVALTSIAGYWIASEIWMATQSKDPAVRRLQPREREDKREGLLLIAATKKSYRVHVFETIRRDDGTADLSERDVPPDAMQFDNPVLQNIFAMGDAVREAARASMRRR